MPEKMPLGILRSRAAEIGADAPIGGCTVGDRPVFDRQATYECKAAPVEHLGADAVEHRPQCRQRKVLAADLGDL